MKKYYLISILLICIFVVSGCQKQQPQNNQVKNQEQTESEVNTSGWQTYRNEEYGFELKYPESIRIEKFASAPNTAGLLLDFGNTTLFVTSKDDARKIDDNSEAYFPYYFIESPSTIKKALDRWEYGKLIFEDKKEIVEDEKTPCFCSKNDGLVCYSYYLEGDLFTRKDILYHDNNRYEFSIVLSSGLDWNKINQIKDPEKKNEEIYTQIKNSSINYLNNIYNKEEKEKNDEMMKIKQSVLFW